MRCARILALVVGSAAGCHAPARAPDASCGVVAASFLEIAKHDLAAATLDEASSHAVAAQFPAIRDALAQACSAGKWSETTRKCLVRANDDLGLETCEQQLTDEQRRDLDRGVALSSADRHGNLETVQ